MGYTHRATFPPSAKPRCAVDCVSSSETPSKYGFPARIRRNACICLGVGGFPFGLRVFRRQKLSFWIEKNQPHSCPVWASLSTRTSLKPSRLHFRATRGLAVYTLASSPISLQQTTVSCSRREVMDSPHGRRLSGGSARLAAGLPPPKLRGSRGIAGGAAEPPGRAAGGIRRCQSRLAWFHLNEAPDKNVRGLRGWLYSGRISLLPVRNGAKKFDAHGVGGAHS